MATVELTDEEAAVLSKVLSTYLGDLRMEIRSTDSFEFRAGLKREEAVIKEVLSRLGTQDG